MKKGIFIIFFIMAALCILFTQTEVYVAATEVQLPLTFEDGSGLSKSVIDGLNEVQKDFKFIFKSIPTKRLYSEVQKGLVHVAAFHNMHWGWDDTQVDKSLDLLSTGDVYIALKDKNKDQSFFDNVGKTSMIGVLGFHYKYANFTTDVETLKNEYNTQTVADESTVIKIITKKRAEIGVVSLTLLNYIKKTDAKTYKKLLISDRYDTQYVRHFIVSKNAPITAQQLNDILKKLSKSGKLKKIYAKYGLTAPVL